MGSRKLKTLVRNVAPSPTHFALIFAVCLTGSFDGLRYQLVLRPMASGESDLFLQFARNVTAVDWASPAVPQSAGSGGPAVRKGCLLVKWIVVWS